MGSRLLFAAPPALSCAVGVALLVVSLRTKSFQQVALFSLFTIYFFRSTVLMLATSETTALAVSRVTQLAYVFAVPVVVAVAHELAGIRRARLQAALWVGAIPLSALFLTDLGFAGVFFNGFGYQVKLGPAGRAYAVLISLAFLYSVAVLVLAARRMKEAPARRPLACMATMLGLNGALLIFAAAGWHIYPPGNFGFVALSVWGYAVLRYQVHGSARRPIAAAT